MMIEIKDEILIAKLYLLMPAQPNAYNIEESIKHNRIAWEIKQPDVYIVRCNGAEYVYEKNKFFLVKSATN
jgi:hypothetical protein